MAAWSAWKLGDVVADVVRGGVAEELELGSIRAEDRAVRAQPAHSQRGVLEEVLQVLRLARGRRDRRRLWWLSVAGDGVAPWALPPGPQIPV